MRRFILAILVIGLVLLSSCVAPSTIQPTETPAFIPTPTAISTPVQITKTHIYTDGKIEVRGSGEPIELINNPDATNPTLAELVAFLERDRTNEYPYIIGPPKNAFVCSDFAETVHNNAEAAGIRAAWVGIDIEGESAGHALNAFETTDLGLVYIDCTGKGLWDKPSSLSGGDRRAIVDIGKPYALSNGPPSLFWFFISSNLINPRTYDSAYLQELFGGETYEERMLKSDKRLEWLRTHDIDALGQKWMQEWFQKYAVELSKSGRVDEPEGHVDTAYADFGSESYLVECDWLVFMLDCWETPWFKPEQVIIKEDYMGGTKYISFAMSRVLSPDAKVEQKIIEVDGQPIAWEVGWDDWTDYWFKPFGDKVVSNIHVHWGD